MHNLFVDIFWAYSYNVDSLLDARLKYCFFTGSTVFC